METAQVCIAQSQRFEPKFITVLLTTIWDCLPREMGSHEKEDPKEQAHSPLTFFEHICEHSKG